MKTMKLVQFFAALAFSFFLSDAAIADQYLKLSTASQIKYFGPFISDTDFKTPVTSLTIANTDIKCLKNGATATVNKNSGGATHIAAGQYYATFDATDSNTLGTMRCYVAATGALPLWEDFQVTSANYADDTYGSTVPNVNVAQIATDTTAPTNLKNAYNDSAGSFPELGITRRGTAQSYDATHIQLDAATAIGNNDINGQTIWVYVATTGVLQSRIIRSYVGSTDTAAVDGWTTTLTGTVKFIVFPTPPSSLDQVAVDVAAIKTCFQADGGVQQATANCLELAPQVTSIYRSAANGAAATAAGSTTSFVDSSAPSTQNGDYIDNEIDWQSGPNASRSSLVCNYNGSTKAFTLCEALPNAVASGNSYDQKRGTTVRLAPITHTNATIPIVAATQTVSANGITAASLDPDVTTELQAGLATDAALTTVSGKVDTVSAKVDAVDDYVDTEVGAIKTKTDFLPSAVAGATGGLFIAGTNAATTVTTALTANITGNISGSVGSVTGNVGGNVTGSIGSVATGGIVAASLATNALNASKFDPDVTTELQTGLATAAALTTVSGKIDTVDDYLDTEIASILANLATVDGNVDAIKLITDQFNFTVAGQVDANMKSTNSTGLKGNGTAGNLFRSVGVP